MKAKTFRTISLVTLSIITLTIYSQNVKEVNYWDYSANTKLVKTSAYTTKVVTTMSEELLIHTNNLMAICKFNPLEDVVVYADNTKEESLEDLTSELTNDIKYYPEGSTVATENNGELETISKELEAQLKYNPSETVVSAENENYTDMSDLLSDLSKDVKYQPSNI